MSDKSPQPIQMHPVLKRLLLFVLIITGGVLFVSEVWVFQRIDKSFGLELAQIAIAFVSIVILVLIYLGVRAGLRVDQCIRKRRIAKWRIYRSFRQVRHFFSLLGYEDFLYEAVKNTAEEDRNEMLAVLDKPRRRGRPPTYSLDRWTRVVLAWENRDPLRNPLTLAEFLCQEFGTYADGSPRMSENSYYDWRKKVFDELRKEAESGQIHV